MIRKFSDGKSPQTASLCRSRSTTNFVKGLAWCHQVFQCLIQRQFEEQKLLARGGFGDPGDINSGSAFQAGLKVQEAAGGVAGRQHLGGERASFNLPGVQRVLLGEDLGPLAGGAVNEVGTLWG